VLLVHALEMAHDPPRCCASLAVLAAGGACSWSRNRRECGRAWIRRRSAMPPLFALADPPASARGLVHAHSWGEALQVPPVRARLFCAAVAWERVDRRRAAVAGVHIVEATKQVYRAIRRARARAGVLRGARVAPHPAVGKRRIVSGAEKN